jgi:hypothetical protein
MAMSLLTWIRSNQPVHITGAILHSLRWGLYGFDGILYKNPRFLSARYEGCEGVGIYCVHGTADNPKSSFQLLSQRLMDGLPGSVSSIHLVAFEKRARGTLIEDYAKQLLATIVANKHGKVILMGHSRGGLIAAYLTEYLAKEAGIEVLLTIPMGSPLKGSYLPIFPFTYPITSIRQMAKESIFLTDLEAKIAAGGNKYCYISAENDYCVLSDSTSLESPGHSKYFLQRHGHLSMMSSSILVEFVKDVLHKLCPTPLKTSAEIKENSISEDYVSVLKESESSEDFVQIEKDMTSDFKMSECQKSEAKYSSLFSLFQPKLEFKGDAKPSPKAGASSKVAEDGVSSSAEKSRFIPPPAPIQITPRSKMI